MMNGYLAPEGYEEALEGELNGITERYGRLFIAPKQKVRWAQNIWSHPQRFSFGSVSEGAAILRSLGPLWAHYPVASIRRAGWISSKLPFFFPKPLTFPDAPPEAPLGSWTLLDDHTLLASPDCSSPFMHGEVHFVETKLPPSRAYLKLWEFFTRTKCRPQPGERCLEIGASPGSWTWALQRLGTEVLSVDRAPLAPSVASLAHVSFLKKDAFSLSPEQVPNVDWVFSDVACYPERLLEWVRPWLDRPVSLVCTLKFQGKQNYSILEAFERIEGSGLIRLFHNKHEFTWYRLLIKDSSLF